MPARLLTLAVGTSSLLLLAACGSSDTGSTAAGSTAVTAGDTSCKLDTTQFDAGSIAFSVTNAGKDTTEVYVYGKGSGGTFDKVVGEVENVAPGASRDFSATVTPGSYEVACKPGQKGDGIRTTITVAGSATTGTTATSGYDREIEVTAKDFAFSGLEGFSAKVGERIEFKLLNTSTSVEHELEILKPDGTPLGEVGPTAPGKDGEVIVTFAEAGTYSYASGTGDDEAKGMRGTFVVS